MRGIAILIAALFFICSTRPAWYVVGGYSGADSCEMVCKASTQGGSEELPEEDSTDACGDSGNTSGFPCCCNCLCVYYGIDQFQVPDILVLQTKPCSVSHHYPIQWVHDVFHPPNV